LAYYHDERHYGRQRFGPCNGISSIALGEAGGLKLAPEDNTGVSNLRGGHFCDGCVVC